MFEKNTADIATPVLESLMKSITYRFINNDFEFQLNDGNAIVWDADHLALVDERLPHALAHDYIWLPKESDDTYIKTKIIKYSLGYWTACNYLITDIEGSKRALASISEIIVEDDLVYLSCEIYPSRVCITELHDGTEYIFRYAKGKLKTKITVVKSVLDKHYPQWQDSWAMLELLGVDAKDRPPYLLGYRENQHLPLVKLPNELHIDLIDSDYGA